MQTIVPAHAEKPAHRISAAKFQRRFGEAKDRALHAPVEITNHGRREFALMSADHYDSLVAATATLRRRP